MPPTSSYPIEDGVTYTPNPMHRNGANTKSQWSISETEEVGVFSDAYDSGWVDNSEAWGVKPNGNSISYLGTTADGLRDLFIAKFRKSNSDWHGYPADYRTKHQDMPMKSALLDWKSKGLISKCVLRKIICRQPCTL